MNDLARLLASLDQERAAGRVPALATLVRARGSSYRGIGARALIRGDGGVVGGISGGCLEHDLALRAGAVLASGRPELVRYDTGADDDRLFGLNIGCGGRLEVLVEPLPAGSQAELALRWQAELARRRGHGLLATRIGGENSGLGRRWWLATGEVEVGRWPADLRRHADRLLELSSPVSWVPADGGEALLERMEPPTALWIFGAGFDVDPLVELGGRLGFEITVVGLRGVISAERFAMADRRLEAADPAAAVAGLRADRQTAALVMGHHYDDDLAALRALLPLELGYLGLLGPRQRGERLVGELSAAGASAAALARVRFPVGLDLGADTPEKVAVAILAEILALAAGRQGGFLRDRQAPIHGLAAADVAGD